MGGQSEVRWCKFGGVECVRSDRGRADCYVCGAVRTALSTLSRLQRENFGLVTRVRELEAELRAARVEIDMLAEERDRACHALGVSRDDLMLLAG